MSPSRIKTIRFFALLAMIIGVLCIPVVLYYGIPAWFSKASDFSMSFAARKHAMRGGMFALMGGLALCQALIGGGGFVRYKYKLPKA